MPFDIDAEAARINALAHASAEGMDLLEARVREAFTRCRDETEEEDIKAVCWRCNEGMNLCMVDNGIWKHEARYGGICDAEDIHERRRRRAAAIREEPT